MAPPYENNHYASTIAEDTTSPSLTKTTMSGLLTERPPGPPGPAPSSGTVSSAGTTVSSLHSTSTSTASPRAKNGRVSRKHRVKKVVTTPSVRRSMKFQAQNFVRQKTLGRDIEDGYRIGDKIGEGGFGEVFEVIHKTTRAERAVKLIFKTEDDDVDFETVNTTIKNEFNIVKSLDHPNLIKQYEMYEDDEKFMIVTDLYRGGELLDELEAIGCFQEVDAQLLLNHMLTCINYIHSRGYAHRDLKPENILLEENMKLDDIKVIDFGLAKQEFPGVKFKDFVGTSYYMSPQIVKEQPYTSKCDIWACGVIAFVVLGGYPPFDGEGPEEICQQIEAGQVIFEDEPEVWDSVSEEAMEFIRYLLAYEEEDRPTAAEALQHPWLQKIRQESRTTFRRSSSFEAEKALSGLENFEAGSKLKQATCALIASQLLLKSEKEDIDEVFRLLDTDCSGRLSKKEVKDGYKDFYETDLSDEDVDRIFERVNFSGSGEILYSEFVVASLMNQHILDEGKVKAAFEVFDIDGNGFIDIDELKTVLVIDDDMDDYVLNKIIKQVDRDGDNQISFDEFKNMMYITASQPSKEKQAQWAKSRDHASTLPMADDSATSVGSGISQKSIKSVRGASRAMSIFDLKDPVTSMLLNDLSGADLDVSESGRSLQLSHRVDAPMYDTSARELPAFRRNRSLPKEFDPRSRYMKVRYNSKGSGKSSLLSTDSLFSSGDLPALEEKRGLEDSSDDLRASFSRED